MEHWAAFAAAVPGVAEFRSSPAVPVGLGLGYLATVRSDGAPRLHPICPIVAEGGLWAFIGPSPKRHDLRRDGRLVLHAFPAADVDDEFSVAGRARLVDEEATIAAVRAAYEAPLQSDDETLFEFEIDRALLATYGPRPSWPPEYAKWSVR